MKRLRSSTAMQSREPIWERQKGETDKAYAAFCLYRDMGYERSLEKVGRKWCESGSKSRVSYWSALNNWVTRARAWDDFQYAERRERLRHEAIARDDRHISLARAFLNKLANRILSINPEEIATKDMPKWLEVAVKLERLAMGDTTENIENQSDGDTTANISLAGFMDAETERLADALLERIATGKTFSIAGQA